MTEKELENLIIDTLRLRGIFCWKNQSVGIFDPRTKRFRTTTKRQLKGVSDILGIMPDGRFLAIEVKRPVKKPRTQEQLRKIASREQVTFIDNINKNGGLGIFADNIHELERQLGLRLV